MSDDIDRTLRLANKVVRVLNSARHPADAEATIAAVRRVHEASR